MPRLMSIAKKLIAEAFADMTPRGGFVVVSPSPKVNRTELICWAIDHYAGKAESSDAVRVLYVGSDPQLLKQTKVNLESTLFRVRHRRGWHLIVPAGSPALPKLAEFTYITTPMVKQFAGDFPPGIDLIVLDERHANEMAQLVSFIESAAPLATLVVTGRDFHQGNPWQRFGEPLVLRGPAQTPPRPATTESTD